MMEAQSEVRALFNKLGSWWEESHREISTIMDSHSNRINNGINDLLEEVCDLKAKLLVTTKERDNLLEKLSGDKLPRVQPLPEHEGNHKKDHRKSASPAAGVSYAIEEDKEPETCAESVQSGNLADSEHNLKFNNLTYVDVNSIEHVNEEITKEVVDEEFEEQEDKLIIHTKQELEDVEESEGNIQNSKSHNSNSAELDGKLRCDQCPYETSTEVYLKKHIIRMHTNMQGHEKRFKCQQCAYMTAFSWNLKQHVKDVHDKIRNHTCGKCAYAASRKGELKKHMEAVHENTRNHVCKECGYAATQKENLKKHVKSVHDNVKNPVCGDSGYAASLSPDLKRHIEAVHGNTQQKGALIEQKASAVEMKAHVNGVHKKFKKHVCQQCSYTARRKDHMRQHMICVHKMGGKPFTCEKCPYTSSFAWLLKRHGEAVHCEGGAMLKCDVCPYQSRVKYNLMRHQMRHQRKM